jgi:hypothetical protein
MFSSRPAYSRPIVPGPCSLVVCVTKLFPYSISKEIIESSLRRDRGESISSVPSKRSRRQRCLSTSILESNVTEDLSVPPPAKIRSGGEVVTRASNGDGLNSIAGTGNACRQESSLMSFGIPLLCLGADLYSICRCCGYRSKKRT